MITTHIACSPHPSRLDRLDFLPLCLVETLRLEFSLGLLFEPSDRVIHEHDPDRHRQLQPIISTISLTPSSGDIARFLYPDLLTPLMSHQNVSMKGLFPGTPPRD